MKRKAPEPMNMNFKEVHAYYRQTHLDFYRDYRYPFYGFTFNLDITEVRVFARDAGYSVYLNLCYFFTKATQELEDFRYRFQEDRIVLYDCLHPSMIVTGKDGLYTFAVTPYREDPRAFNEEAGPILERARVEINLNEFPDHNNFLFFSALPGVPFTALTHVPSDRAKDSEPKVTFGQFFREGERWFAPVGIQVNHLFVDGAALGRWVDRLKACFQKPV